VTQIQYNFLKMLTQHTFLHKPSALCCSPQYISATCTCLPNTKLQSKPPNLRTENCNSILYFFVQFRHNFFLNIYISLWYWNAQITYIVQCVWSVPNFRVLHIILEVKCFNNLPVKWWCKSTPVFKKRLG
jgi:hypothetical protein